jgi:hypothetical protein
LVRARVTQVIVGGVAAVLVVAGIDALRASMTNDQRQTLSSTTTTVPPALASTAPACAPDQVAVSIEVRHAAQSAPPGLDVLPRRRVVATVVVRRLGGGACSQDPLPFALNVYDRDGRQVGAWLSTLYFAGAFEAGTERDVSLPAVYHCDRPGPFHAIATAGPYVARRGHLSNSDITCWQGRES